MSRCARGVYAHALAYRGSPADAAVAKFQPDNLIQRNDLGMGIVAADKPHFETGGIQNSIHVLGIIAAEARVYFVGAIEAVGAGAPRAIRHRPADVPNNAFFQRRRFVAAAAQQYQAQYQAEAK